MAARFVDVSESEIDQFKENAVPQKTKEAAKIWSRAIERQVDTISLLQVTQFTENSGMFLYSFCFKVSATFSNSVRNICSTE